MTLPPSTRRGAARNETGCVKSRLVPRRPERERRHFRVKGCRSSYSLELPASSAALPVLVGVVQVAFATAAGHFGLSAACRRARRRRVMLLPTLLGMPAILPGRAGAPEPFGVGILVRHHRSC